MKGKRVRPLWQLDDNGILNSIGVVVLREFESQSSCLNADRGIKMRIEICRASKNFGGDLIFLDRITGMIERVFAKVSKKLKQRFRAVKNMTIHKPLYFLEALLPTRE